MNLVIISCQNGMVDHWHEFVYKAHCAGTRARPRRACAGRFAPPPFAPPARAAEVISSNTVGYQKLTIPAGGYALLANPFTIVGSDGDTFPINDMFTGETNKITAGQRATQADMIQPWDSTAQGYKTYFFSSRIRKWSDGNANVAATTAFDPSDGYWYFNRSNSEFELTVSGEVATNEVEVTLVPGYSLVCNPFPADLPLNGDSIDWKAAGANAGQRATQADNIQTWNVDNQGYTTFFFSSRINQWSDGNANVATDKAIPAGQGFWYLNRGENNIVITLKSPLAQ